MTFPTVSVTQGSVHVNEVSLVRWSETALVFQADLSQKYAGFWGTCTDKTTVTVMVGPALEDEKAAAECSQITIHGDYNEGWETWVEICRYTATITLLKQNHEALVLWTDDKKEADNG